MRSGCNAPIATSTRATDQLFAPPRPPYGTLYRPGPSRKSNAGGASMIPLGSPIVCLVATGEHARECGLYRTESWRLIACRNRSATLACQLLRNTLAVPLGIHPGEPPLHRVDAQPRALDVLPVRSVASIVRIVVRSSRWSRCRPLPGCHRNPESPERPGPSRNVPRIPDVSLSTD